MCNCRPEELPADFYRVKYDMESAVKRKTLLKNGKKPSVRLLMRLDCTDDINHLLHGMSATVIQHIFQAVVIAKLTYASQSWSGFTLAADIQRLNAFLSRSVRQGFCPPGLTNITNIFDAADKALFCKILHHPNHLLAPLLPIEAHTPYHLRPRRHNRQLIPKINFIQRMLYKDLY